MDRDSAGVITTVFEPPQALDQDGNDITLRDGEQQTGIILSKDDKIRIAEALAEAGVHIIENLVMDGLIEKDVRQFCFMLSAVKFKGATGCPVRPIAIV